MAAGQYPAHRVGDLGGMRHAHTVAASCQQRRGLSSDTDVPSRQISKRLGVFRQLTIYVLAALR